MVTNLSGLATFEGMNPMSIDRIYGHFVSCGMEYCTDSRKAGPGDFFVCLRGERFDANLLVQEVLDKDVAFLLTDNEEFQSHDRVLWVEDSLEAFQALAAYHASTLSTRFIAVGGSNGKTSTKELIHLVLAEKFKVYATPGNFNNHVGVPMTLLALREEHEIAVVELGTNHPGEMEELCQLFRPHYGVITNIGKEHLEGFGTEEAVAREESELYLRLQECGGKAFVNADDAWLSNMSKRLESKFSYGIQSETADLHGRVLSAMPHLNFELGLPVVGSTTRAWHGTFQAQLGGSYNLYNVLAAIAIGMELGISLDQAAAACCSYVPSNNRSQWVQTPKTQVYLDAYNANPSSMLAALSDFVRLEGPEINRKAVLLGDMFELGENEVAEHKAILDWLFQQPGLDVYLCGPRFKAAAGSFPMVFDSAEALLAWLDTHPIEASYAFIKGSRGMKMEKALEHFQGLS